MGDRLMPATRYELVFTAEATVTKAPNPEPPAQGTKPEEK